MNLAVRSDSLALQQDFSDVITVNIINKISKTHHFQVVDLL